MLLVVGLKIVIESIIDGLHKKYTLVKPPGAMSYTVFFMITCLSSLLLYGAAAGFNLRINMVCFLYAFFYSILSCINQLMPFLVLRYTNLVTEIMFAKLGSLAVVVGLSILLLQESISPYAIAGACLTFVAAALPLLQSKERSKVSLKGYALGILMSFTMATAAIINKKFATDDRVVGNAGAYCFYINLFLVVGWIVFVFVRTRTESGRRCMAETLHGFTSRAIAVILLCSVFSAVNSLLFLYLSAYTKLSYFLILINAGELVAIGFISKLIFHEELNKYNYYSIVLAIFAIILTTI